MNDKKKYLKSYRFLGFIIGSLNEMIAENPSRKDKYLKEIERYESERILIENSISKVEDQRLRTILYEKYICGRTLEEISLIMNYSKRQIERLHIAALNAFNP